LIDKVQILGICYWQYFYDVNDKHYGQLKYEDSRLTPSLIFTLFDERQTEIM